MPDTTVVTRRLNTAFQKVRLAGVGLLVLQGGERVFEHCIGNLDAGSIVPAASGTKRLSPLTIRSTEKAQTKACRSGQDELEGEFVGDGLTILEFEDGVTGFPFLTAPVVETAGQLDQAIGEEGTRKKENGERSSGLSGGETRSSGGRLQLGIYDQRDLTLDEEGGWGGFFGYKTSLAWACFRKERSSCDLVWCPVDPSLC